MPRSKQLNFFLTVEDQKAVERAISMCGEVSIFDARSATGDARKRENMCVQEFGKEPLRIVLSLARHADKVIFTRANDYGDYSVNVLKMPVIEFDRCYVGDGYIRRGRVYAIMDYHDDEGLLIHKPEVFINWVKCVFAEIENSLSVTADGCFIGDEARSLSEKGWSLKSL